MICNMDSIGKYMLGIIFHQQRTLHLLKQKKLMQTQEDCSNPIPALNVDSLKVDLVVIQNTCFEKKDNISKTASNKLVKESILDSATKDVHAIKYKMSKAKERCMAYFQSLHLHLQVLSKEDIKDTRIKHGFKREIMSLFGQDADTFTSTMLLSVDQLQKQLKKMNFKKMHPWQPFGWSGNDTYVNDADIRPIYDEEPMAETSVVYEKISPRSDLRWKPTGRIFKIVGLRWIPIEKLFDSCTSKVNSEPPHGSNANILNIHECKQTLDVSAEVPTADMISMTTMIELESLSGSSFNKYFNRENQVVSKSSAINIVDASDKCQQQPDSTLSTSTLATTVSADGNFDL
nr:hypothetical protein [Tanacetum cinerariifolium]